MMLEGDLYKGTSPHIVGTAFSNDQTSGGDVNFRYQTVQANGTGLVVQAYFDRTLRTHGFLGDTRNTIDLDFVDRFKLGGSNLLSVGAGLRWSPFNVISYRYRGRLGPAHRSGSYLYWFSAGRDSLRAKQ